MQRHTRSLKLSITILQLPHFYYTGLFSDTVIPVDSSESVVAICCLLLLLHSCNPGPPFTLQLQYITPRLTVLWSEPTIPLWTCSLSMSTWSELGPKFAVHYLRIHLSLLSHGLFLRFICFTFALLLSRWTPSFLLRRI